MRPLVTLIAATVAGVVSPVAADSIHLVGGRIIHTESARVENGHVIFTQLGGTVSIPAEMVVRIIEDHEFEQPGARSPRGSVEVADDAVVKGDDMPGSREESPGSATGWLPRPPFSGSGDAPAAPGTPSPDQPEYWSGRILEVDERIGEVQARLDRLPAYDQVDRRLLRFSGQTRYLIAERKRWTKLMRDLQASRRSLLHDARKAGITPGALRKALRR